MFRPQSWLSRDPKERLIMSKQNNARNRGQVEGIVFAVLLLLLIYLLVDRFNRPQQPPDALPAAVEQIK